MQANHADDFAINDGNQNVVVFSTFVQKITYRFQAPVRQLQRVADNLGRGVTLPYSFGVRRFRFANSDFHKTANTSTRPPVQNTLEGGIPATENWFSAAVATTVTARPVTRLRASLRCRSFAPERCPPWRRLSIRLDR